MKILRVTKNQGFTLSLGHVFLEKTDPMPPAFIGIN